MKYWLKVALLFGALFLTGVDAKERVADEGNLTSAGIWVDSFMEQMVVVPLKENGKCGKKAEELLNSFIRKVLHVLDNKLPEADAFYLQDAVFSVENIAVKQPLCFTHQKEGLIVLKKLIKNQLK